MRKQKRSRFFAGLLAVVMMLTMLAVMPPQEVRAEQFTYGDFSYTVDEDRGVGIAKYNGSDSDVTIPSSIDGKDVTFIWGGAFNKCSSLKSVTIPAGVKQILMNAFADCSNLKSATIASEEIWGGAFSGCTALENLTITSGVKEIWDGAFSGCSSLREINLPSSLTSIVGGSFSGCDSLNKITVAEDNPVYDSRVNCNAVIKTEENVLVMGCKNTTIPSSVKSIGDSAFDGCSGLPNIEIPSSVTSIGDCAFSGCSGLINIEIPSSVTSIGDSVFSGCSNLKSVTIPSSVKSIGDSAFSGCSNLKSVTIPSSVTSIGEKAFRDCSSLSEIEIPAGVASLGEEIFYECWSLVKITVAEDNPVYDSRDNCNAIIETEKNTLVEGCKNTKIPDSVTAIGHGAFLLRSVPTKIVIPSGVTAIGSFAFSQCNGLTEIVIPNSVTAIGQYAFLGCNELKSVTIPSGVTYISDQMFTDCSSLTEMIIPSGVKNIGYGVFINCSSLKSLTIPSSVTSIRDGNFYGCSSLKDIFYDGTKAQWVTSSFDVPKTATIHCSDATIKGEESKPEDNKPEDTKPNETVSKSNQTFANYTKAYAKVIGDKAFSLNAKLKTGNGALGYKTSDSKVVTVDNKGKITIKGTGCATITVTAAGTINYNAASVTVTVTVSPKKPTVKSLKIVKGKKLTVKWVKDKNATGYEICCSTDKKFKKGVKTASIAKNATVSKTLTKLTKGKRYFVRIRAYKTAKVGGKSTKLYSVWSSAKQSGKIK